MESILKTLLFIKEKRKLKIQKQFLTPVTGFSRLRKQGLIEIHKEDVGFYANLTDKGEEFLITNIHLKLKDDREKIQHV